MTDSELIFKMKSDYNTDKPRYDKMKMYFDGNHDINRTYTEQENRSNQKIVCNYVGKLCEEEIAYTLGNPLSFTSYSGDKNIISDTLYNLFHWKTTHNQELMRTVEIYGKAYEVYYTNADGEFCGKILNPTNAAVYFVDDEVYRFIHFYKKRFDEGQYYDVYYPDRTDVYRNDVLIDSKDSVFHSIPVSVCEIGIEETIYSKIKSLNDSLNNILSDNANIIGDYRNAYMVVSGVTINDETAKTIKDYGIINLPTKDAKVEWLIKSLSDAYIVNQITELKSEIYTVTSHIDYQEHLQSNVSGVALRSRLISLEQRCKTIFDTISDTIYDRFKFLFEYMALRYSKNYDWRDIAIQYSPCVPQDLMGIAQTITQMDGKISLSTALSHFPWVENPSLEIEKLKQERAELEEVDLDKLNGGY